jgi:serine phosphatase RsbU (regulator of sigma subunit)/DNA-binding NarL/FixJ family response regulator
MEPRDPRPSLAPRPDGDSAEDLEILHLLLIEESRAEAMAIRECLAWSDDVRVELEHAERLSAGLVRLKEGRFHAVVVDLHLPDSEGLQTVLQTHACAPRIPIVVLTGFKDKQEAIESLRVGAEDYLCKSDLEPKLLLRVIRYAIERAAHRQAVERLTYLASFPERAPHPIMELGLDGGIRYLNPAADRLFSELREQGLAHPWLAGWAAMVRRARRDPAKTAFRELAIADRSYQQFYCYLAQDEAVRIYGLDVSERKQAVEALRASEKSLREREAHLMAAQGIQTHLWPAAPPLLPGFDIAGAVYPAEYTAGDYFDYLPMLDGSLGLVVGDVCGHGLGAAIVMALTCAHLRSLTQIHNEVEEILRRINRFLIDETDRFVTLLFARLDGPTRTLVCTNAGHPAGYVLDASGQVKARIPSTTLPLAIVQDAAFPPSDSVALKSGDVVLLLTDGVLEAKSPADEPFGIERTLEVVHSHREQPAAEIVAAIHRHVEEFCSPQKVLDDVTAIVIKVT